MLIDSMQTQDSHDLICQHRKAYCTFLCQPLDHVHAALSPRETQRLNLYAS